MELPFVPGGAVRQCKTGQEVVDVELRRLGQPHHLLVVGEVRSLHSGEAGRGLLPKREGVHPEVSPRRHADGGPLGDQEALADGVSEAVEGAPQTAPRLGLIALGPEQGGQRLPTLRLVGHAR